MIGASAFAVFALGLRHGADPDHLAAIDNLTRNSLQRHPRLSKFAGTLFACGHAVMVLAIALLVGFLGSRSAAHGALIETAGTWVSIAVLLLLGVANLLALRDPEPRASGLRARLVPRVFRSSTHAWMAMPVGFLFGVGFETSSQIAAYAIVFGSQAGIAGSLLIGAAFCLGMACTDTLDSLLVHRLVTTHASVLPRVMRLWIATIALLAFGVAGYQIARTAGLTLPIPDLAVSAGIVAIVLVIFSVVWVVTRSTRSATPQRPLPPA